jgi:hypothetical protein
LHYDECRPGGFRPTRSLESKWELITHDVSKFIGVYKQVFSLNKSESSAADTLCMAKKLYRTKSTKNIEFMFEYYWLLVKDFPRWADGCNSSKQVTSKVDILDV